MADKRSAPERPVMATQRISLADLERLRATSRATRGLPSLSSLQLMLGASLDDDDVGDLGLGEQQTPNGVTAASKALGIEMFASQARVIEKIVLHSEGHERHHVWAGDLGNGLSFSSTTALVRKARGGPSRSGTGWDCYETSEGTVQFSYGGVGLLLVTLTAKGSAR